jgi:hypothetical protein
VLAVVVEDITAVVVVLVADIIEEVAKVLEPII